MTIEQTYTNWKNSVKSPDDSLFYYHKNLERIILSLAIFEISSRRVTGRLGKAEMLKVLNLQIPDLITAWIDEDEDAFNEMFPMVMTICETYMHACVAAESKYPESKKSIRDVAYLFANSCGVGGDMEDDKAEVFIDDISTDGEEIFSEKIKAIGNKLLILSKRYGLEIPLNLYKTILE